MKIYTKTGDKGTTSLFGGKRVAKHNIRIDSYGTVDELNANLGLVRDQDLDEKSKAGLVVIQEKLFTVGAILASDPAKASNDAKVPKLKDEDIQFLEDEIDRMNEELPPMTHFVLPGGHVAVSHCHVSRTVCRRAERICAALFNLEPFDDRVLKYLNRLSDYLFVLARSVAKQKNADEVKWIPDTSK
ncbi:cob(I)yrinic acid a,c-diamide adenosyltransferase [Psychroflexus tropicus]|uniref:cob(I)yrinic acid a,c-diamide adenosyltransferase n=1 Tax=Psychroflexus tropicus TaxID=197345 RepID=UPI0003747150|nr:cob(I)yrinic acid a,c-diamide adenosyltransferase [Psychroflexus tropicus]